MKKIITVDLDNVLAKTTEAFLEYYAKHYGKKVDINEIQHAYFKDNKQFDAFNAIDTGDKWHYIYCDFMGSSHFEVVPGAVKGVKILRERGYSLHVVTGRGEYEKDLTYTWIEENFSGVFEDIHFAHVLTEKAISKGDICQSLGAILHIDDFLDFSTSVADQGIPVYLFDKPWNQDNSIHPLITRVAGWEEVVNMIEK